MSPEKEKFDLNLFKSLFFPYCSMVDAEEIVICSFFLYLDVRLRMEVCRVAGKATRAMVCKEFSEFVFQFLLFFFVVWKH